MTYGNLDKCPHCGSNQIGEPIPEKYRDEYYGGKTHYKRTIGMEVFGVYDGMLYYRCPDCGGNWHRFGPDHYLHDRAVPYVNGEK